MTDFGPMILAAVVMISAFIAVWYKLFGKSIIFKFIAILFVTAGSFYVFGAVLAQYTQAIRLSIVIITNIVVATALTLYLKKYVTGPLTDLTETAEQVAKGDLGTKIDTKKSNDEIGTLVKSFKKMKRDFESNVQSIQHTLHSISKGDLKSRMNVSELHGDYKTIGKTVNSSINKIDKSLTEMKDVMSDIEEGDLDSRMDTSDVEGAYKETGVSINNSVDSIQNSIGNISDTIDSLSEGDLDTKINTEKMQGDYREMG